jgi:hypothetical protein
VSLPKHSSSRDGQLRGTAAQIHTRRFWTEGRRSQNQLIQLKNSGSEYDFDCRKSSVSESQVSPMSSENM